jgi:hypothetical protein
MDTKAGQGTVVRVVLPITSDLSPSPNSGGSVASKFQKAATACKSLRPSGGFGGLGGSGGVNSTAFAAYRNCLKLHGVTLPTGGASKSGAGSTPPTTIDQSSPTVKSALAACASLQPSASSSPRPRVDDDDFRRFRHEGTTHEMKLLGQRIIRRKTLVWYGALGVALALVATFGLESIYGTSSASTAAARTVTVQRGTVQSSVSASGNVSAATSDSVDFGTSGTITAVDVTAGQTVTAGQVLGTLDPTDAQATLTSAQAALSAAQYNLTSAEQGGTTAQQEQDQATNESAQNQLTSDKEQLTTDETDLTAAQKQLAADEALGCPGRVQLVSSGSTSSGTGVQCSGRHRHHRFCLERQRYGPHLHRHRRHRRSGHELLLRIWDYHRLRLHHRH